MPVISVSGRMYVAPFTIGNVREYTRESFPFSLVVTVPLPASTDSTTATCPLPGGQPDAPSPGCGVWSTVHPGVWLRLRHICWAATRYGGIYRSGPVFVVHPSVPWMTMSRVHAYQVHWWRMLRQWFGIDPLPS